MSIISSSKSPAYPRRTPFTFRPLEIPALTTARIAAFIPGASPPLVNTPIVVTFFAIIRFPPILCFICFIYHFSYMYILLCPEFFFNTLFRDFHIILAKFSIQFRQQFFAYFRAPAFWQKFSRTVFRQININVFYAIVIPKNSK